MSYAHPEPVTQASRTLQKVLTTTDPEVFSTTPVPIYGSVMLYGYQGFTNGIPDANSGNIYCGWDPEKLTILVEPGPLKGVTIGANPRGLQKDFATLYVKGAINDGLVIEFTS